MKFLLRVLNQNKFGCLLMDSQGVVGRICMPGSLPQCYWRGTACCPSRQAHAFLALGDEVIVVSPSEKEKKINQHNSDMT